MPSRTVAALALLFASLSALALGCDNKMDPKECDKIRGAAFDMVNSAQHCSTDADCRLSEWPGCARAVSNGQWDKVKPMSEQFQQGKCEEKQLTCRPSPAPYCKQGLCVLKEIGTSENSGNTPADQIIIQ